MRGGVVEWMKPGTTGLQDANFAALQAFVNNRDVACTWCGYNLRGLKSGSCPECGRRIILQLFVDPPKPSAMIAGLIALSAGLGINGLGLLAAANYRPPSPDPVMDSEFNWLMLGGLFFLLATISWICCWRALLRKPWLSWLLALVAWMATVGEVSTLLNAGR